VQAAHRHEQAEQGDQPGNPQHQQQLFSHRALLSSEKYGNINARDAKGAGDAT
jgi:hypothetical protein